MSIRLNEREVGEKAVVGAAPNGQRVVPPVGVEDVHHAAETHGLQRAKAQLDRDPLDACAELYCNSRTRHHGGRGGDKQYDGIMMWKRQPLVVL